MKKIPTIFMRNSGRFYDAINPECQWVFDRDENGEYIGGVLRKYDGLCCMIDSDGLWQRVSVALGAYIPPTTWKSIQIDDINGIHIIWERVPFDIQHWAHAELYRHGINAANGTYELIGPDINGNPEKVDSVRLMRHDHAPSIFMPHRSFEDIKRLLEHADVYGYVFVHPDGRKAKINRTHFGFDRIERGIP